jgi:hypothetical protein
VDVYGGFREVTNAEEVVSLRYQTREKSQSLQERLVAMKRVRLYENRVFQRLVDQYDLTFNHLGLLLTCFLPRGDGLIFKVKQHLKSEFGNFVVRGWPNCVNE